MTARDLMTLATEVAAPDDTVLDARDRFRDGAFHHLPVVEDGRLVGVVSDRDILRAAGPSLAATPYDPDVGPGIDRTLREVMTRHVVTADPLMSVEEIADTLLRLDISALPVVEEGCLVGIVTTSDVLRFAAGQERAV